MPYILLSKSNHIRHSIAWARIDGIEIEVLKKWGQQKLNLIHVLVLDVGNDKAIPRGWPGIGDWICKPCIPCIRGVIAGATPG